MKKVSFIFTVLFSVAFLGCPVPPPGSEQGDRKLPEIIIANESSQNISYRFSAQRKITLSEKERFGNFSYERKGLPEDLRSLDIIGTAKPKEKITINEQYQFGVIKTSTADSIDFLLQFDDTIVYKFRVDVNHFSSTKNYVITDEMISKIKLLSKGVDLNEILFKETHRILYGKVVEKFSLKQKEDLCKTSLSDFTPAVSGSPEFIVCSHSVSFRFTPPKDTAKYYFLKEDQLYYVTNNNPTHIKVE